MKDERTSLEKSHSKWSNFKLTIMSLFTSVFFAAGWVIFSIWNEGHTTFMMLIFIIDALLFIINLLLFRMFSR